jgi:ribose/xylose/arabinose/galactoside ABC-type transport system permease subunit
MSSERTARSPGVPGDARRPTERSFSLFHRYGTELTLGAVLLLFVVVLSLTSPVFLTQGNLSNLVKQASTNGIIALGAAVVIISGGIDLSVGSVVGLSGIVAAIVMVGGINPLLACLAGLLAAAGVGVVNAAMIYEGRIPPFIATLATMTMARGLVKLVTDARTVSGLPDSFLGFGEASYFGLPSEFCVWMVLAAGVSGVLTRTRFGRNTYAVGASQEVARLSGIDLRSTIYAVYVVGALMAGVAGLVLTARVRMAAPTAGMSYELYAIAAAVVGGVSLAGAQGSILGVILGTLIMTTITNGGNLLGIDAFTLEIAVGALIALAVWLDRLRIRGM